MASSSKSCTILDLPDEVLELIIAKLPLLCILQLRLVCTKWSVMLHDTRFLERYVQLTGRASFYVRETEKGFAAYSPEMNDWYMWPKSFISAEGSWRTTAGGDGFLHLLDSRKDPGKDESVSYLVNPITGYQRKLLASRKLYKLRVVFDERSKSHKIFGLGCENNSYIKTRASQVFLYNPELPSWELIGAWNYESTDIQFPIFHRGVLHCLATETVLTSPVRLPNGISRYRHRLIHRVYRFEGEQSWSQLTAAHIPSLKCVHMFEWQGNVMLVGGRTDNYGVFSSVEVWRLDEEKNIWVESLRMPDSLLLCLSLFKRRSDVGFRCHSGGNYIYLSRTLKPRLDHNFSAGQKWECVVTCDLSKSSWWEAPGLSSVRIGCCFVFTPSLEEF